MFLKLISIAFLLFAITRVWLRYRDGSIGMFGAFGWGGLWLLISGVVWLPNLTTTLARIVGVGRGADAMIYASIITLFYAVFRLYVKSEYLSHQITHLVRALSIKDRK
jgi:hypothetical protein